MKYLSGFRNQRFWTISSTVFVLVICLKFIKPSEIAAIATNMGWNNLVQVFMLVAISQILRALRFFELIYSRSNIKYILILKITCIYQFLNHILPLRSGEFTFPFLLKRYSGHAYSSSVAQLILTRLHDMLALVFIISFSLFTLMKQGIIQTAWLFNFLSLALCLFLAVTTLGLLLWLSYQKRNSNRRIEKLLKIKSFSRLEKLFQKITDFLKRLLKEFLGYQDLRVHLKLFSYSMLIWLVLFLLFWKVLLSANISISFAEVILGSSLANLTQLLPLNTIGNIGTLEVGWVLGFSLLGFDSHQMFNIGLLMHTLVIIAAGVYALISWITFPKKVRD